MRVQRYSEVESRQARKTEKGDRMNLFLTVDEAARIIDVKAKHIYYLAAMGQIEALKIRKTWRLFLGSVEEYAQGRNKGKTHPVFAADSHDQRRVGIPSLFGPDYQTDDMGRRTQGVHGRRGMEYRAAGSNHLPLKTFQLVDRSLQMELFSEAI
jgi:excisionase family DNA binding protein